MSSETQAKGRLQDPLLLVLGWALLAAALMQVVLGLGLAPLEEPTSSLHGPMTVVNVFQHLLWAGGVVAVARAGAAGKGRLALVGVTVSLLGFGLLVIAELATLVSMTVAYPLFGVATIAQAVGLTTLGVGVVRARRWTGWSRWTLLACGLYIPIVLIPAMLIPGLWFHYAIGIWGICFLLLAVAVLRREA